MHSSYKLIGEEKRARCKRFIYCIFLCKAMEQEGKGAACVYFGLTSMCLRLWLWSALSYEVSFPLKMYKAVNMVFCSLMLQTSVEIILPNDILPNELAYTWTRLSGWEVTDLDASCYHWYHSWWFYSSTLVCEPELFVQVEKLPYFGGSWGCTVVQLPRQEGNSTYISMCLTVAGKRVQGCFCWVSGKVE